MLVVNQIKLLTAFTIQKHDANGYNLLKTPFKTNFEKNLFKQ